MNVALHQDQMRVTSIPYNSTKMVIFSGVPLKKTHTKLTVASISSPSKLI